VLGQEAQECFDGDQDCQDCSYQDCSSEVSQDWRSKLTSDQVFIRMDQEPTNGDWLPNGDVLEVLQDQVV